MSVMAESSTRHTVPRQAPSVDHLQIVLSSLQEKSSPKGVQHTADTTSLSAHTCSAG